MPAASKAPSPDARRDMAKELAAAAALKHQLQEAFGEEPDVTLLRDMIEGETNLDRAFDGVLEQIGADLANIQGIDKFETTMAARKKRLADRVETLRTMLRNALDILEMKSIERPLARLTLKPTPAKLLIVNEAEIPSRYFKQPAPELSKADLTADLKDRRDTLEQKIEEVTGQRKRGEINDEIEADLKAQLLAAFPPIPGAELDNGSVTIQVKWS